MAQRTQKAIREGFISLLNEVPFEKITVLDIAARSSINRNTFYYYYGDIFALVDDVLQTETQHIRNAKISAHTWSDVYIQVTTFARVNQRAIYNLYNSQNRERLESYLYDIFYVGIESFIVQEAAGLDTTKEDVHVLAVFYASALVGLAVKWMRGGMQEDADAYINRLSAFMNGSVRAALFRNIQPPLGLQ